MSQPLTLRNPTVELEIEPGTAPRAVAQTAVAAGVQTDARLLYAWFRLSGKDRQIRAGNYEILPGTTPYSLLQKLVQGDESLVAITFVEGWTFRQMRAAIAKEATLKPDIAELTEAQIMAALGKPGVPPKGASFPIPTPTPKAAAAWPCCAVRPQRWTSAWPRPGSCATPPPP